MYGSHTGEAVEDRGLVALVEAQLQFPIQDAYATLEDKHLPGELGHDGRGDVLRGQLGVLALGSFEGLLRQGVRLGNAALFQVSGNALTPRPADSARGLVAGHQLERAHGVEVQSPL